MKKRLALIATVMLFASAPLFAQESKPAMDLPVYPGGEATMEINMGNEDILPMMKAMLPLVSGQLGKVLQNVNIDELAAALKDVRQIEMLQVDVATPNVAEEDVAGFYAKNLPSGAWNRVFWQSLPKTGTIAVYAQPGAEALYGFRVQSVSMDSKPIKRVHVAKIQGKIDFVRLLTLAGKLTPLQ